MGLQTFTVHKCIVKKHNNKLLEEWPKLIIHKCLKSRGGICKSKGLDHELIMPLLRLKNYFMNVIKFHMDLMIPDRKSNLEKVVEPNNSSCNSSTIEIGYLSLTVASLRM